MVISRSIHAPWIFLMLADRLISFCSNTACTLLDTYFKFLYPKSGTSLVAQMVKNLPAMQATQVQSLGGEDPLEKEMAPVFFTWWISWTEEPGGLQSMALQNVRHDWVTSTSKKKKIPLWIKCTVETAAYKKTLDLKWRKIRCTQMAKG